MFNVYWGMHDFWVFMTDLNQGDLSALADLELMAYGTGAAAEQAKRVCLRRGISYHDTG
jgi:hypothetical protein